MFDLLFVVVVVLLMVVVVTALMVLSMKMIKFICPGSSQLDTQDFRLFSKSDIFTFSTGSLGQNQVFSFI